MYAATLTAAIASPAMEVPIDSLSDLLQATQEGRAVPSVVVSSSMEALFKVRLKNILLLIYSSLKILAVVAPSHMSPR